MQSKPACQQRRLQPVNISHRDCILQSYHRSNVARETNEERDSIAGPAAAVSELTKDITRIPFGCHDPKWKYDSKEAEYVDEQDDCFYRRKELGEESIESYREDADGNCEHRAVPTFEDVALVVQDNEPLNHCATEEGCTSN